jgi:hypothetical protein
MQQPTTHGRDAITKRFLELYPSQNPPAYYDISADTSAQFALDGIGVYECAAYHHFITYGLSELYEKRSSDWEYSGYGFELTMRLKKSPLIDEREIVRVCAVLKSLALYIRQNDFIVRPYEHIYLGFKNGIDTHARSKITGFVTVLDDAGEINTPNGKVEFVQLIGATDKELQALIKRRLGIKELLSKLPNPYTDFEREDVV